MPTTISGSGGISTSSVSASGNVSSTYVTQGGEATEKIKMYATIQTTSGVYKEFTDIPDWAKRITLCFNGVSSTGNTQVLVQLGTASGVETTGYYGGSGYVSGGSAQGSEGNSSGVSCMFSSNTEYRLGAYTFTKMEGNIWCFTGVMSNQGNGGTSVMTSGVKQLAGPLKSIRVLNYDAVSTFDWGSISLLVEG